MRKILWLFTLLIILCSTQAVADIGWEQAEKIVKNLPCSKEGNVDQYLSKKAEKQVVEDLGWNVYRRKDGFEVERLLLLNQTKQLIYKWHVDSSGNVKPVNDKAMEITKKKASPQTNITNKASSKKMPLSLAKEYCRYNDCVDATSEQMITPQ